MVGVRGFCGFFRVFVWGGWGFRYPKACIIFEAQSRLNFAAIMLQHKNVGFHLKRKSKNDNQARKGVRLVASMMKARKGKAEEKQRGKHL